MIDISTTITSSSDMLVEASNRYLEISMTSSQIATLEGYVFFRIYVQ